MLFGKEPEQFLIQNIIKCEAHIGNKTTTKDIRGSLIEIPDEVIDFLKNNMRYFDEIVGIRREKVPEYPIEALREAIMNAIVHRDYSIEGSNIVIQLLNDKILFKSPGLPLEPLTIESIKNFNAPSYTRNPRISEVFNQMDFIEKRGWGLTLMKEKLGEANLPTPQFNIDVNNFIVTFLGREHAKGRDLNKTENEIYEFIKLNDQISSSQIADHFKFSQKTATRYLNSLLEKNLITKQGEGPSTVYNAI